MNAHEMVIKSCGVQHVYDENPEYEEMNINAFPYRLAENQYERKLEQIDKLNGLKFLGLATLFFLIWGGLIFIFAKGPRNPAGFAFVFMTAFLAFFAYKAWQTKNSRVRFVNAKVEEAFEHVTGAGTRDAHRYCYVIVKVDEPFKRISYPIQINSYAVYQKIKKGHEVLITNTANNIRVHLIENR